MHMQARRGCNSCEGSYVTSGQICSIARQLKAGCGSVGNSRMQHSRLQSDVVGFDGIRDDIRDHNATQTWGPELLRKLSWCWRVFVLWALNIRTRTSANVLLDRYTAAPNSAPKKGIEPTLYCWIW